jgi:large repetitive protein
MMMIKRLNFGVGILLALMVLCNLNGIAQDFSRHNWYFGQSTNAIRFSRTDNSASLVTKTGIGLGGAATASDQTNANLLFYTDGTRVIDVSGVQMPNGGGLTGNNNANQPAAITPVPGQPNQYYIFTNSANNTTGGNIVVTTVDMTLFGTSGFPSPPFGDVTTKNVAFGLSAGDRSEAMITIPHTNGTDYWLISHQNGTDTYTVTQIQAAGAFNHTTISGVTGIPVVASNFAYHGATGKIAVTPQDADRNVVILNFDNASGALTLDQFVLNSASTVAQDVYDTEWSPSGRFLYISRDNNVLQFDLNNPTNTLAPVLPATVFRSYGLQFAPDSAIYHLYESSAGVYRLGKLQDTDSLAANTRYTAQAFAGSLDFDAKQFPSFSASATLTPTVTFTTAGSCSNSPISFFPTVTPTADSLTWSFGDGNGSSQWSPVYTYQNGGSFPVTVTPFLNGQAGTPFTQNINVTQFNLQLTLVQDTTACQCEFPPPVGTSCNGGFRVTAQVQGGSPTSAIWSNGDTGLTLTPDSAGYYYLVVTDATGCTAYAGVNVREYDAIDQRANIWYFGQNAGIDFNQQPAVSLGGPLNSPEGVSVISDRNGQVVLSTDGVRVYDRNDNEIVIPVPPGIGGDQGSTQAALIIPVPGDETLYYIFTTQEIDQGRYEVRYSLFDLKLNNGDGGLVQFNQLLFSPSTERITGNGAWLIAHEFGNNSFRAYQITPVGINNPVITSIGSDHGFTPVVEGQGYMKLSFNNVLAVAYPGTGSNFIEYFDFDNSTGVISNFRRIDTQQNSGQVYGIEFAGNKMFATIRGATSSLVEFYFDSLGVAKLIPPPTTGIGEELGAIQLGPDGQIYVAVNNKPYLATIQVNPDTTMVSNITIPGFNLTNGQSRLGLPNFIQSVGAAPMQPSISVAGLCLGDSTLFSGSGTDPIDQFIWSFGDGFGANTQVAQHVYAAAGTYLITLQITNRCGLDTTLTQSITISAPPPDPSRGMTICNGPVTLDANPSGIPNLTYLWSTGATTQTIQVSQQAIYTVDVTNASGCVTTGSFLVADNRPQVNLGPDQTICQNTPIAPLDAQNPGTTYAWTINGAPSGNTQTQNVDTTVPGVFQYIVTVTDPVTTCTVQDTVTFTIGESPNFTAVPSNTTGCGTLTGQIALTINSPVGNLFSFGITGPATTIQGIDQGTGPVAGSPFMGLGAGTYGVTVTDQVSGCTVSTTVGISDNVIAITGATAQSPTCNPVAIDVQTSGIVDFTGANYTVTNSSSVQVIPPTPFNTANFTTLPVPVPGTYTIQINAQSCLATFNLSITADPPTALSITPDPCNARVTAASAAGATFDWSASPAGSIVSIDNTVPGQSTPTLNIGTWALIVTVSDGVNCPTTQTVNITVPGPITASFTQSDACANQVTLTASPTGSFTYRWYNNSGTLVPGGSTLVVGTSENGANYGLEVVSTITGCVSPRFNMQIFVAGNLQLTMTTTTPCSGTPFTLTGSSNIAGTNFQWAFNGTNVPGATNTTYQDTRAGKYKLIGTLPGCTREIEQQIILFPSPVGRLPQRALICNNPANPDCGTPEPNSCTITLDAGPGFVSYEWFEDGVSTGVVTQTYAVTVAGITYSVLLENSYGCIATDQTLVEEQCKPRIVAPTAFRPGSGIAANNAFQVFSFFIDESAFQVFIYNRWGELVFQSNDHEFRWNGGYNNGGQLLPAGTYSYVVKYRANDGGDQREQRGGVVLLR